MKKATNKRIENKSRRSPNGTGCIKERSDGRFEGQYYYNGERKSCYAKSEEECRGKLNICLAKIYKGSYIEGSMMPLYVYLNEWHNRYTSFTSIKPATHKNYDSYIEGHFYNSRLGSIPLKKLTLLDFCDFFAKKETSGRLDSKPGGLSPKSIRNIRNMAAEALDYAVNNLKWIERNPMHGLKTAKVTPPEIKVFDHVTQDKIEKATLEHENINALMVLVDLYNGLRIGELCGLMWPDFGRNNEYFKVKHIIERLDKKWADGRADYQQIPIKNSKSNSSTALYLGTPKTDVGKRIVYLSEQAVNGFNLIKLYQIEHGLFDPNGFVFVQKNGNPYEPRTYTELYRKILKQADVSYQNFHTLRHTFATRAFELNFDIPTLSEILVHAQKSTTENMYGHSLDETKKAAMAKFNNKKVV